MEKLIENFILQDPRTHVGVLLNRDLFNETREPVFLFNINKITKNVWRKCSENFFSRKGENSTEAKHTHGKNWKTIWKKMKKMEKITIFSVRYIETVNLTSFQSVKCIITVHIWQCKFCWNQKKAAFWIKCF